LDPVKPGAVSTPATLCACSAPQPQSNATNIHASAMDAMQSDNLTDSRMCYLQNQPH
jgi:hypothetical protein